MPDLSAFSGSEIWRQDPLSGRVKNVKCHARDDDLTSSKQGHEQHVATGSKICQAGAEHRSKSM